MYRQPTQFQVLVVCTGNVCRSPIAAQLLRSRTAPIGEAINVQSAGTRPRDGQPMTGEAAVISRKYGGKPEGHFARVIDESLIERADLILTATREHRASVASTLPKASRYSFTLNEFVRLGAELSAVPYRASGACPEDTLRSYVRDISSRRGMVIPLADPGDDDVEDPYRREFVVYEQVGVVLDALTNAIAGRFRGVVGVAES